MAVTYKYLEPPQSPEKAVEFMQSTIVPIITEYWYEEGREKFGRELAFNVLTFIQMWMMGSLVIIIAIEGNKVVGILIGVRFVPMLFDSVVVQVEVLYGQDILIERGIYDYLKNIVGFMNVKEIWMINPPTDDPDWPTKGGFDFKRLMKGE